MAAGKSWRGGGDDIGAVAEDGENRRRRQGDGAETACRAGAAPSILVLMRIVLMLAHAGMMRCVRKRVMGDMRGGMRMHEFTRSLREHVRVLICSLRIGEADAGKGRTA